MKKIMYIFITIFMMNSCKKNDEELFNKNLQDIDQALKTAQKSCGGGSLVWFGELLAKAEEDRKFMTYKGNYIGIVSIIRYKEDKLFFTDFGMGSGGIAYYLFDCEGHQVIAAGEEAGKIPLEAGRRENMIYSSINI